MKEELNNKPADSLESEEIEIVSNDIVKKPAKRLNVGSLFWGMLFILIGALLLLDNLQVVDVNFGALWQLWPIAIIGAGVSMLSLRGWLAGLVSFLLIVATLFVVGLVSIDNRFVDSSDNAQIQKIIVDKQSRDIKNADITIDTGASDVVLSSSNSQRVVEASLSSDGFTLNKTSERRDDTQYVTLSTESARRLWLGNLKNKLEVDLTQLLPLSISVDAGASRLSGDLSEVQLNRLTLDMGASDVDLTLGDKQALQDVYIDAGASSVTLRLPQDVGVRVYAETGLASTQFKDVPKISEGFYQSDGFDKAINQVIIRTDLGASSFRIERY